MNPPPLVPNVITEETFMRTILMAFIMALSTQLSAEDLSTDNYSTDNKLLSEVKTRMVLDNGLGCSYMGME
jgi:hypothetical protein